jgi:hypothetical protein
MHIGWLFIIGVVMFLVIWFVADLGEKKKKIQPPSEQQYSSAKKIITGNAGFREIMFGSPRLPIEILQIHRDIPGEETALQMYHGVDSAVNIFMLYLAKMSFPEISKTADEYFAVPKITGSDSISHYFVSATSTYPEAWKEFRELLEIKMKIYKKENEHDLFRSFLKGCEN